MPKNGTRADYAPTASDGTIIRDIWKATIEKIVCAFAYDASDMKATADFILDLARRISPEWITEEGVEWGVSGAIHSESYLEPIDLLFAQTIQFSTSSRWYTIES